MQKERRASEILQFRRLRNFVTLRNLAGCEIFATYEDFTGCPVCCADCFLTVFCVFYQNTLDVIFVLSYFYVISLTLSTI